MPAAPARTSSCPGPSARSARPCMRSASSRAIARPRPAPCASSLDVKNGSKMWGMFWRLMPRPRSETSSRTCPLSTRRRNTHAGARRACGRGRCPAGSAAPARRARGRIRARSGRARRSQAHLGAVVALRRGRELGGDLARELADVGRLGTQLQRAGLQPREVEQLGRELRACGRPGRGAARGTPAACPRRGPRRRAARGSRRARRSACAARARRRR